MALVIRIATAADADVVMDFNRKLAAESEGKNLDPVVLARGVQAVLADPHKGYYFLAEQDGRVLGQMAITFEWSDWRNGWFWWIQSVYVCPEWRRRGIFRALFAHVLAAARQDPGVIGLRLYVDQDNQVAHHTYTTMGMAWTGYQVMEHYPLPNSEVGGK